MASPHPPPRPYGRESGPRAVRHRSELGHWDVFFRKPDPRVRGHVLGEYQGWVEKRASFARRREIPSAVVPLILNLGPAFRMTGPGYRGGAGEAFGSFVAGLHESFVLVEATGPSICLQVDLTPIGAYRVLGVPMGGLANRCVGLEDVLGQEAGRLVERLHEAPSWSARFDVLDAFLVGRIGDSGPEEAGVAWALGRLVEAGGCVAIGALADGLGCSHRHLIARFREQVGLPPKVLARILRFGRVVEALGRGDRPRWVEVAHDCGYFDQAHLIRDFGEFAGITPGEYLGRILPEGLGLRGD